MKLVLAEKPSVAQSLAKVLGANKRCDGYLEGNGYIASSARRKPTTKPMPNGGWLTFLFFRITGSIRYLLPPGSSMPS